MILVDIYVPVVDRVYDFHLDETKCLSIVIEDIVDMICQKEQWQMDDSDASKLSLWLVEERRRLNRADTLNGNGIRSGMQLMLV